MTVTDDAFLLTAHRAKKKEAKRDHDKQAFGPEIDANAEKQEKTVNIRMEEDEQGNKNLPISFKFFSLISNCIGYGDTGPVIIRNEKHQTYDIKKGPFHGEQHLFNETDGNPLTDPKVLGPLYFPDSQIITMPMSGKSALEIKRLFSQICGKIDEEQAYSLAGYDSMLGNSRNVPLYLTLPLLQVFLHGAKDDMNLRNLYVSCTLSDMDLGYKQVPLDSKGEKITRLHSPQLLDPESKISQMTQVHKQVLIQQLYGKILSQEEYQGQQMEKAQKVAEDSKDELKNYSSLRDNLDTDQYLYYRKREVEESGDEKNYADSDEEKDSNFKRSYLNVRQVELTQGGREEDTSELLVMYYAGRHVLLLVRSKGSASRIEEMIQLQWDLGLGASSLQYGLKSKWTQKSKDFDPEEEPGGFNSIDKNVPKAHDLKTKHSDELALGEKEQKKDLGRPDGWQSIHRPMGSLKIVAAEVAIIGQSISEGSSSFDEEEEGAYSSFFESSLDEGRERECEISSCPSSVCSEVEAEGKDAEDSLMASPVKGEVKAEGAQALSGEVPEIDALGDQRDTHPNQPAGERSTVGTPSQSQHPRPSGQAKTLAQRETPTKAIPGDEEDSVGMGLPSGAAEGFDTNEGHSVVVNDVETDGGSLRPHVSDRPSPLLPGHRNTSEAHAQGPPLHTPVQVSSWDGPGCGSPDPSESRCSDRFTDGPHEDADGQYHASSTLFQPDGEHPSQLGACAGHTPVVAQEQGISFNYGTQASDDCGVCFTEESHYSFVAQETGQHEHTRPRAPSPPHLLLHSAQPLTPHTINQQQQYARRAPAPFTLPIIQSQPFYSGSPAPVRLAPITVHAAGSLPPWATNTARIDLSRAARRDYAQLRSRRATYEDDWPTDHSGIDPANMALAGFFRDGGRRRVRCFYCGLELEPTSQHNIWDEHVRYRRTCAYLQAVMGPDFVLQTSMRLNRKP